MLSAAGVRCSFVAVGGETRINTVLIEEATGAHTTLCAESLNVTANHIEALIEHVAEEASRARLAVLAGSLPENLPAELYPRLIAVLRRAGVHIVLDTAEPFLGAALAAGVDVVKPNRAELARWSGAPVTDVIAAAQASRQMREAGAGSVLASLDRDGMLLVDDLATWYAPRLEVGVINPSGAGDGAVAGLCYALLNGACPREQLESAIRIATAVCLTPGTAEFRPSDLAALPEVRTQRLE
jgi:1-phosphofructokinase